MSPGVPLLLYRQNPRVPVRFSSLFFEVLSALIVAAKEALHCVCGTLEPLFP